MDSMTEALTEGVTQGVTLLESEPLFPVLARLSGHAAEDLISFDVIGGV